MGTIAPKKFIARLRKEKVEFDNYMQQVSINELQNLRKDQMEKTKEDLVVLCSTRSSSSLDYTRKTLITKSHMIEKNLQDAHEFLIFLINHINEIIVGEQPAPAKTLGPGQTSRPNESPPTWINDIFQVSS